MLSLFSPQVVTNIRNNRNGGIYNIRYTIFSITNISSSVVKRERTKSSFLWWWWCSVWRWGSFFLQFLRAKNDVSGISGPNAKTTTFSIFFQTQTTLVLVQNIETYPSLCLIQHTISRVFFSYISVLSISFFSFVSIVLTSRYFSISQNKCTVLKKVFSLSLSLQCSISLTLGSICDRSQVHYVSGQNSVLDQIFSKIHPSEGFSSFFPQIFKIDEENRTERTKTLKVINCLGGSYLVHVCVCVYLLNSTHTHDQTRFIL